MSQKNQFRFLMCFLFSAIAHSGVLVASLFLPQQIVQEQDGSTLKLSSALSSGAAVHTVELIDAGDSHIGIKGAPQVAELTKTLPTKAISEKSASPTIAPSAERQILLAKEDDPTAVEIKKPTPSKRVAADQDTNLDEEKAKVPAKKKKVVPTKKEQKKALAAMKKPNPKAQPKKEEPKEEPLDDVVVANNEELKPVKEHVDAQAKANDEEEMILAPAPTRVAEAEPTQLQKAEPTPLKEEFAEEMAQQQEEAPPAAAPAPARAFSKSSVNSAPPSRGAQGGVVGEEELASTGGAAGGIRDGDSLEEVAGNTRPVYPLEDRRARKEGTAVFVARVTPDGRVTDIKLESSATSSMNAAAIKAFAQYHYKTGQQGMIRKKFVFKLNGEAEEAARLRRTSQYSQPATGW